MAVVYFTSDHDPSSINQHMKEMEEKLENINPAKKYDINS